MIKTTWRTYLRSTWRSTERSAVHVSSHMSRRWARLVSNVLSPPLVWAVLVFTIAFHVTSNLTLALTYALVYGVMICLLPLLYIGWMVRRGKISDIHMKERRERIIPFLVSVLCSTLAWVALRAMNAPDILPLVAAVTLIQLSIMAVITLFWQISMHAMGITVAVVAMGVVFGGGAALATSPLVPIVVAARLSLRRHTLAQVVAGTILGVLIPLLVVSHG
ncbi:MAG: hypothetical protein JNM70_21030 [Anaerolineae bacterium]|nr:hypothetical protein [Anaerolineae bacterium]